MDYNDYTPSAQDEQNMLDDINAYIDSNNERQQLERDYDEYATELMSYTKNEPDY